jgi:hypothetical protein
MTLSVVFLAGSSFCALRGAGALGSWSLEVHENPRDELAHRFYNCESDRGALQSKA